jgi:Flp pilus assembly pilin Flp
MLRRILSAVRHLGSALLQEQDGQDLVEYALLMAFIALAAVSVLTSLSANLSTLWDSVSNALSDAVSVSG